MILLRRIQLTPALKPPDIHYVIISTRTLIAPRCSVISFVHCLSSFVHFLQIYCQLMPRTYKAKQISQTPDFTPKPLSFKREGLAVRQADIKKKEVTYEKLCELQQQAFRRKLTDAIQSIKTTDKNIDAGVIKRVTEAIKKKKQQLTDGKAAMPRGTLQLADTLGGLEPATTYRAFSRRRSHNNAERWRSFVISHFDEIDQNTTIIQRKEDAQHKYQDKQEDIVLRSCTAKLSQVLRLEILDDTELLHHVHSKFLDTMQYITDEMHDIAVIAEASIIKFAATGPQRQFRLDKFTNKEVDLTNLSVAVTAENESDDYVKLFTYHHLSYLHTKYLPSGLTIKDKHPLWQDYLPYEGGEFSRSCPAKSGLSLVTTAATKKYATNLTTMWRPATVHKHIYRVLKTLLHIALTPEEIESEIRGRKNVMQTMEKPRVQAKKLYQSRKYHCRKKLSKAEVKCRDPFTPNIHKWEKRRDIAEAKLKENEEGWSQQKSEKPTVRRHTHLLNSN